MSHSNAPPPPKAKVLPSPYPEPLQHFRAFRGFVDNFGIVPSRLRTSSSLSPANVNGIHSPSWGPMRVVRASIEFLKISGIDPSWLRTSFSPSPANANDSEEEPNIEDSETLMLDLEQFENVYSLSVCLTDGGHNMMESIHSVSYDDLMPFMPLHDYYIQFGAGDEQYYISIYRPIATFRVAPQTIVILQYEIEMIWGTNEIFSMERSNFVSLWVAIKAAEKCRIPKQLDVPVRKKQKRMSGTSSLTRRKRAVLHIALETIEPHYGKTLKQAAEAIKISESKLKDTVQDYGYESWSDFKYKARNALSKKATHLSLTTTPHGGDVSNTSGLLVLNPSDQCKNLSMPVVIEAANVDQQAAADSVNATMFSSQPHEMPMQQIQAYGGTQFGFQPQNQSVTISPPETSSVCLSHVGSFSNTFRFPVLNESNQHNLPMTLQAGNVNHSAALSSLRPDEMLMQLPQVYGGTNDLLRYQPRNQFVTTSLPETTMQEDRAAVIVKATYGETNIMFELFSWSKMEDLNREVTKRLDLEVESFQLKYLDVEGDLILIRCDADLKVCMDTLRTLGWTTVKMLVSPTTIDPNDFLNFDMSMG